MPADCAAVCTEAATACMAEAVEAAELAEAAAAAAGLPAGSAEQQLLAMRLRVAAPHFALGLERVVPCSLRHLAPEVPRWATF